MNAKQIFGFLQTKWDNKMSIMVCAFLAYGIPAEIEDYSEIDDVSILSTNSI